MRRVLWLCSWYPNAADPFTGDFVKRQAEALSELQPLTVVFAGKYPKTPQKPAGSVKEAFPNLQENILYYPSSSNNKIFTRIRSFFAYFKKHKDYIRQLKNNNELPDLVHVQVAFKAGLIALYLKRKYKIPYVLTEHWTGYYRQDKNSLFTRSFPEKYVTRLILKHAVMFLPVCEALGFQIQQNWLHIPFRKIPNVVNTTLFYPGQHNPDKKFRFIHISTLKYPKNPEGIVRAFTALIKEGVDAELVLVGPAGASLLKMIPDSGLPANTIRCTGEVPYEQVAAELRQSSALIQFSFCENLPCVILESLCSGLPVIATRVGGIPEVVDSENGILVNAGEEHELLEAMKSMMDKVARYNKEKISREAAKLFSYDTVAREILAVYDSVLKPS